MDKLPSYNKVQLQLYHATNYKNQCPDTTSSISLILSSWKFLAYSAHIMGIFSLPIQAYCFYLIVKKTPKRLNVVIYPLLIMHSFNVCLDITLSFLATPYLYWPCFCGTSLGLLRVLGVPTMIQLNISQFTMGGMGASLVMIFENRFSSLIKTKFKINRRSSRYIYLFVNYMIGFTFLLPANFRDVNEYRGKMNFIASHPCPDEEFFGEHNFLFVESKADIFYSIVAFISIVFLQVGFYFFRCVHYLKYEIKKVQISEATKKLQQKTFFNLSLNVLTSIVTLMTPVSIFIIISAYDIMNQGLTNILVVVILTHGFNVSIMMIFLNEPYRIYTKGLIMNKKEDTTSTNGMKHQISPYSMAFLNNQI